MREGRTFTATWASLAEEIDYAVSDLAANAEFTAKMLGRFNKAYLAAYNERAWEDAWEDGELEVTDRALAFSEVDDARLFEFWSSDPRISGTCAQEVPHATGVDGITFGYDIATVYAFWKPVISPFTLTAYGAGTAYALKAVVQATNGHNYVCIQAGTGQTPQTSPLYWRQQPVLDVLADPAVEMAAARYMISQSRYDEGNTRNRAARTALETSAQQEFVRLAKRNGRPWRPANFP